MLRFWCPLTGRGVLERGSLRYERMSDSEFIMTRRKPYVLNVRRCIALVVAPCFLLPIAGTAEDDGQNLQIAPPPIAYPFFTPGRQDYKITGSYFSMEFETIEFGGGGIDVAVRKALSRMLAISGQIGFMFMSSDDLPSVPIVDFVNGDMVMVEGGGVTQTLYINIPMSANLEVQAVNIPEVSLITFAGVGPSLLVGSSTPDKYRAIRWDTNLDGDFPDLTATHAFGQKVVGLMTGLHWGLQAGVPLGSFRLAPFFTARMTGGSMQVTFASGYEEVQGMSFSATIPATMSTSLGMDIIYEPWGLSIGTVLQQIAANRAENEQKTVMLTASYHFRKDKPPAK